VRGVRRGEICEGELLAPLLEVCPDAIRFIAYEELEVFDVA